MSPLSENTERSGGHRFFSFSKVSDSHSVSSSLFLFCSPLALLPFLHCQACVPLLHLTKVFQLYLQILRVSLWLSPPRTINVQACVTSGSETRANTVRKESTSSISPEGGSYWSSRVCCQRSAERRVLVEHKLCAPTSWEGCQSSCSRRGGSWVAWTQIHNFQYMSVF